MLEERQIRSILEAALAYSKAEQTEVSLHAGDSALTRFANNYIHQNVAESTASIIVRAVLGKRVGVATVSSVEESAIRSAMDRALEMARHQHEDPDFRSLPAPAPTKKAAAYVQRTADFGPEERAAAVAVVCRRAQEGGLVASGAFSNGVGQVAIANSLGLFAYHLETEANYNTVVMSDTGSGYGERWAADINDIDPGALAAEAIGKAQRSRNPASLEAGEYTVVLEEYAVSDILDFLAYLGFSAKAVQEGHSFMAGRFGAPVVGENISIWDDALGPGTASMPFDFEGVPKQRVDLIVDGVANAVCHDSYTAWKENVESTGHALPGGHGFGPVPRNLYLQTGDATLEDMIASTRRGILVTRFHYTRVVHPLTVTITGMTRDGTFLIEDGRIVGPVKNFRFTQSYLDALSHVEMIGRDSRLMQTMFSYNRVPALKIEGWNFTGVTEY
ncbi:MAG: TldD/PmbA family protein [Dehalococcoidia bacterium]|nr:TldD/PmbA family protein [Dehalococcoidia bacterium]